MDTSFWQNLQRTEDLDRQRHEGTSRVGWGSGHQGSLQGCWWGQRAWREVGPAVRTWRWPWGAGRARRCCSAAATAWQAMQSRPPSRLFCVELTLRAVIHHPESGARQPGTVPVARSPWDLSELVSPNLPSFSFPAETTATVLVTCSPAPSAPDLPPRIPRVAQLL